MFSMPYKEVRLEAEILGSFATSADILEKVANKGPSSHHNTFSICGLPWLGVPSSSEWIRLSLKLVT